MSGKEPSRRGSIHGVSAYRYPAGAPARSRFDATRQPDRVYVRVEKQGRVKMVAWGMEYAGRRSEVVQPVGTAPAANGSLGTIELDLRRGVGLAPPL